MKVRLKGFSLVELLAVVAIMSILATIGLPLLELAHRRTQEEELRRALREIRGALDHYKRLVEMGHIATETGGTGFPPNLEVLTRGIEDAKSPGRAQIYLLRQLPRDPMASPKLPAASSWRLRSYDSPPDNPQPGRDVFDVYSSSDALGLNGLPYSKW